MSFDYSKLRGRIKEKYETQAAFAKDLGISERTLSLKMRGKRAWTQGEIDRAIFLLELSEKDIPEYFFTKKVQKLNLRRQQDKEMERWTRFGI